MIIEYTRKATCKDCKYCKSYYPYNPKTGKTSFRRKYKCCINEFIPKDICAKDLVCDKWVMEGL